MDTVVGNKYLDVFSNLDIEVSKKLEGEYEVDEIVNAFGNFFFNKMFLDITSIKGYKNIDNLKKLSMSINMDKVILLLDKDDAISSSNKFLSSLVSMGIYNFTTDSNSLMYLYNNPNIYRDVAHYQEKSDSINNTEDDAVISQEAPNERKILGIRNITDNAGATTLAYLIKKVLEGYYSTMVMEIDKMDLTFFRDKDTLSIKDGEFENTIKKYDGVDIIIVDLNKSKKEYLCSDVLYLIEPSTIKLNKLSVINPKVFGELKGKNILLNKCLIDKDDIGNFEIESNLKVFYNIGCLNDKKDVSEILLPLLVKLGYVKEQVEEINEKAESKKSIFDIFKKK